MSRWIPAAHKGYVERSQAPAPNHFSPLNPLDCLQIRFVADPSGEFTKALDLDFDATKIFGNHRSKRYALVVQNGKVK